ncbi:MAG: AtpZ/AtpI family protein [Candidatus Izemoplasmatales bacterium]|uniref:AtpZ/AtpI family protein n=1 Tax=Hujiaoplasma nucleasis TaxID=2725268 RepID=A0A7L6N268_9MOLU|nr:AtpZ/AtpI family protein [Hujiaoplasma nucleasis]QLY40263.1 AtpZ/AtpI family protein [Hujiaoplasma nucleasis]
MKSHKTAFLIFNMITQFFIETFVAMIAGYFLGKWLDGILFDQKAILTYVLVILGIFAGLRNFIKRALKFEKEGENNEK